MYYYLVFLLKFQKRKYTERVPIFTVSEVIVINIKNDLAYEICKSKNLEIEEII